MVKIKGFTLIELMVVIAIIGILISVALGPVKTTLDSGNPNTVDMDNDNYDDGINTPTVINGVKHLCDTNGNCEPMD